MLLLVISFIAALSASGFASVENCPRNVVARKIEEYFSLESRKRGFSGAILIAREGRSLLEMGFNYADRERRIANTANTKFAIGSITKQFTAAAILQLVERGKVSLKDPVVKHLSDSKLNRTVTIENLLTHTSGISDYVELPDVRRILASEDPFPKILAGVMREGLGFPPGAEFEYSNTNYVFLGEIIRMVSGLSYDAYLAENLLAPARMSESGVLHFDRNPSLFAVGYTFERPGQFRPVAASEYEDLSRVPADGGMYSTVRDLFLWHKALKAGRVISLDSLSERNRPRLESYGFGVTNLKMSGKAALTHSGIINGFESYYVDFPKENAIIILLGNREDTSREDGTFKQVAAQVANRLFCGK